MIAAEISKLGTYAIQLMTDCKFIGRVLVYLGNVNSEEFKEFRKFSFAFSMEKNKC
jgi:hypothetical protein